MNHLKDEWTHILKEYTDTVQPKAGSLLVVGCSTSEVAGNKIGTSGSLEVAETIFQGLQELAQNNNIHIAVQCCEHLNRALVIEEELAIAKGYTIVQAVPDPKAGGALGSVAYRTLKEPVLVEHIQAEYGIDIGSTLIGMHLKHVAIPVRLTKNTLGNAYITYAKTRPKYIGGPRTIYQLQKENTDCSQG